MAEVKIDDVVLPTCAVEVKDDAYGRDWVKRRCNAPSVSLCEKHLDEERTTAQRGYSELRAAYDQARLILGELVGRVEAEAAAKMRLYAAVDAAKSVLR